MPQVPACECSTNGVVVLSPLVACDGGEGSESVSVHVCNTDPIDVNIADADITVNVDVGPSVEISNDVGNPVPISGTVSITDGAGPVTVDGTVATNSERAEDSVHTSGDVGNFVLGVRNDAGAVLTSANGDYSPIATDDAGRVGITDLGGSITVDGTVSTVATAATSGGLSMYRNLDVNATGQVIKGSAGQVYTINAINRSNAERFVKLYNKATAPTAADTPVMSIPLDGTTGGGQTGQEIEFAVGTAFALGIGIRATNGIADADVGNPGVNNVVVHVGYK